MTLMKRVLLVASLALSGVLTFTATTWAVEAHTGLSGIAIAGKGGGGGGGLPAAGTYRNTNIFANVSIFGATVQLNVSVNEITTASHPRGQPATSTHETDVNFQACDFTSGVCGGGCFIPDGASDFVFSTPLTAATLSTNVTASTQACLNSPIIGLPFPFTVNVTWTVPGPLNTSSNQGRYACGAYTSVTLTTTAFGPSGTATVTTSLLTGTFQSSATLSLFQQRIQAQGTAQNSCSPLGGKGAGPGPQTMGYYQFASTSASFTIVPADPTQPSTNVFVTNFTNVSRPRGGPSTTVSEVDLNIFQFAFPQIIEGCFVIPSSAFTIASNLSTATLNASIDSSTPACPQFTNTGLPSSFTANATWTGSGAVAKLWTDATSDCASFHVVSTGAQTTINASATGGFSGIADSFTTTQAFLGTLDTTTHIHGVQTCF